MVYGRWREGRRRRTVEPGEKAINETGTVDAGTVETGTVDARDDLDEAEVSKEEERSRGRGEENRDERDEREASVFFSYPSASRDWKSRLPLWGNPHVDLLHAPAATVTKCYHTSPTTASPPFVLHMSACCCCPAVATSHPLLPRIVEQQQTKEREDRRLPQSSSATLLTHFKEEVVDEVPHITHRVLVNVDIEAQCIVIRLFVASMYTPNTPPKIEQVKLIKFGNVRVKYMRGISMSRRAEACLELRVNLRPRERSGDQTIHGGWRSLGNQALKFIKQGRLIRLA
ncbi:hypothetical protein Syun_021831 [Stephania yunnanensis]|uniref:Uncharacterized protein n=1 Tax=Stephania yunnanensis TaxID=152371 RepID=A0AAP0IGB4_9MAGN